MAQSKFLSLTGLDTYDAKIKDWVEKKGYTTPEGHTHDGRYYTETEVNNLLKDYLKLAGGTITGTLTINRDASAIHYNNSSGTSWGWMGFKAKDTPAVWENTGTTSYNILHAGNSGVSLSGSTLTVKLNGTEHSLTNTTYGSATQSTAGLMTAADKKKLDGIAAGANNYTTITAANLEEGTSNVTDNTEILTSYASDNGFADTNAPNKIYKRDAIKLYNYIKGKTDSVYAAKSHGNHVPTTQTANNSIFLRNDNTWQTVTPANIGAAASSHNHAASEITSGVLALARIPTGTSAGSVALGNHTHNYAAASHGNHVPATQTANNAIFLRNDNTWQAVTPANIGAAEASHTHAAGDITSGTFAAARIPNLAASKITSGTFDIARIPTGTSAGSVALGNHTHSYAPASHGNHVPATQTANNAIFLRNDNTWQTVTPANIGAAPSSHNHDGTYAPASHTHAAGDITSGVFALARIPTGTSAGSVALGNHTHSYAASNHNHNGTYAPASHTHSYLSLDGGTLNSNKSIIFQGTGSIQYKGSVATYPMIQFIDNSADGNGNGIKIGGGGSTLIGGGESADQTATLLANGGNEKMIISNDQTIDFYTNCQSGIGSAKSFSMGTDGKFYCGSTAVSLEGHTHSYAASNHNHDSAYAAKSHNHDTAYAAASHTHSYAASNHNHDSAYAAKSHNHDTAYAAASHTHSYAASNHNHDSAYAAKSHNHDTAYAAASHNHAASNITSGTFDIGRIPTGTSAGSVALGNHTHSYAASNHNHDSAYAAKSHNHDTAYAAASHNHDTAYAAASHTHSYAASNHNHDSSYAAKTHTHDFTITGFDNSSLADILGEIKTKIDGKADSSHTHSYAASSHNHAAGNITSGVLALARIPTGTSAGSVALGNHTHSYAASNHNHDGTYAPASHTHSYAASSHNHAAGNITSGTLALARIPTGTSAGSVALGDHTHGVFVKSGAGAAAGFVPAPSTTSGSTKYLREDGTWNVPPGTSYTFTNKAPTLSWNTTSVVGIVGGVTLTVKMPANPNTDTDTKVTNNTTTSTYYLCGSTATGNTTGTLVKRSTVYVNTSSAVYASGGFYESSDERLKNFGDPIEVDLEKIKKLPKKYFTWKKDKDNKLNIGTSAQELQKLYPEIVSEGVDGYLNVNYEKLSIVALAAIDKLQDKYDKKIQELEDKLNKVLELIK